MSSVEWLSNGAVFFAVPLENLAVGLWNLHWSEGCWKPSTQSQLGGWQERDVRT